LVTAQDAVQTAEYNDQLAGQQANDQTAVTLSGQQYGYLNNEVNDATSINLQALNDQTQVNLAEANYGYQLGSQVLNTDTASGLYGASGTTLAAITAGQSIALQEPAVGIAAETGTSSTAIAQANANAASTTSIMNGITSIASKALTGFFA
jgi:hypothetical protein